MAWTIKLDPAIDRDLGNLDPIAARRILAVLRDRVANLQRLRRHSVVVEGPTLGEFWKFDVGGFRVIARIEREGIFVLVVRSSTGKHVHRQWLRTLDSPDGRMRA